MKQEERSARQQRQPKRETNEKIYEIQAEFCKGLAHPKRILIINLLKNGELSVSELVRMTGIPQANLSQHLGFLRQQGVLTARRSGMNTYYSIADKRIIQACELVREIINERIRKAQSLLK